MSAEVVVLDYGSGNIRSAERALERAGARVTVSASFDEALEAPALVVPGVGAFAACMAGIRSVRGDTIVDRRLAGGRPVLGICVGMQVMFERGVEQGEVCAGLGEWPGTVERLEAPVLPHMGWNTVEAPVGSALFAGLEGASFSFLHSYGVREWSMAGDDPHRRPALVTWAEYGSSFIAAVENGPLVATQFHPEKSGDAGIALLENWLGSIT